MDFQFIPYLWFSGFSLIVTTFLGIYAWMHRNTNGSRFFFIIILFVIIWILTQALELAAMNLQTKIILANIQYISVYYGPVFYLILVLQFTGNEHWIKNRILLLILIAMPLILQVFLWTNPSHELIRQDIYLDTSEAFPVVGKTFGPIFWVFACYNFFLSFASLAVLGTAMRSNMTLYREQLGFLFIGLLLPVTTTALHISGILPIQYDLTPAVFGLSGVFISWGIYRCRIFDAIPVAHSIIIEQIGTGVIIIDDSRRIVDINPAAQKILGIKSSRIVGKHAVLMFRDFPELLEICQNNLETSTEVIFIQNESVEYYEISYTPLRSAAKSHLGWLMAAYNITERKLSEESTRILSLHDPLTNLPNRKLFYELAEHEFLHADRSNDIIGIAFIDLDDFKQINDNYGHEFGDMFLMVAAMRLKEVLRQSDVVSRIGGDEFALLLPDLTTYHDLNTIAEKIFTAFSVPLPTEGDGIPIRGCIGFSTYPRDGRNMEILLKKADNAMYQAKRNGKNQHRIYEATVSEKPD